MFNVKGLALNKTGDEKMNRQITINNLTFYVYPSLKVTSQLGNFVDENTRKQVVDKMAKENIKTTKGLFDELAFVF